MQNYLAKTIIQRIGNKNILNKKQFGHIKNFAQNKRNFTEHEKHFAIPNKYFALAGKYFADQEYIKCTVQIII